MTFKTAFFAAASLTLAFAASALPAAAQGFNGCALVRLQAGCSCSPDINGAAVVTCPPVTTTTSSIILSPAPTPVPLCDWANNWCQGTPAPIPAPAPLILPHVWGDACSRETVPADCSCRDVGGSPVIECNPLPNRVPTLWRVWDRPAPLWTPAPAPIPLSGPRCSARVIPAGCVCTDIPGSGGSTMSCL